MTTRTFTATAIAAASLLLALAGCTSSANQTPEPQAGTVEISDAWVKAADSGMTGAFGWIVNESDQDITVVSVTSDVATTIELHETVADATGAMIMRPKDGGFPVAAGQTFKMEPGANHIMLLDLAQPLVAGADVVFTLTLQDGSTVKFTAPVKEYSGANESYEPDMEMGD